MEEKRERSALFFARKEMEGMENKGMENGNGELILF